MSERGVPEEIPAHWLAYFAVEDADATVARAFDNATDARLPSSCELDGFPNSLVSHGQAA